MYLSTDVISCTSGLFLFFFLLSSVALSTRISLSVRLLLAVYSPWFWWIKLLWTFMYKSSWGYMFLFCLLNTKALLKIYLNEVYKWGIRTLERVNDLLQNTGGKWPSCGLPLSGSTPKCLHFESFLGDFYSPRQLRSLARASEWPALYSWRRNSRLGSEQMLDTHFLPESLCSLLPFLPLSLSPER